MDNLIFSLNATVPIFLLMVLGFVLRKLGLIDDVFASKMNKFVFLVPLPVLLFEDLSTVDFSQVWNLKFVLFCFAVTLICIIIAALVSFLWRDKSIQGEFIQASYRSSAALLGIAFIQNIYGNAGMAPLMIIGSVPLYNIMAVVVLSFFKPERKKLDKEVWMATLKGIVTNPIILGIVAGLVWSAFKLPVPPVLEKTVSDIGATATPLGLMAMGASFDLKKAFGKAKPAVAASVMKLVLFAALFLPLASENYTAQGNYLLAAKDFNTAADRFYKAYEQIKALPYYTRATIQALHGLSLTCPALPQDKALEYSALALEYMQAHPQELAKQKMFDVYWMYLFTHTSFGKDLPHCEDIMLETLDFIRKYDTGKSWFKDQSYVEQLQIMLFSMYKTHQMPATDREKKKKVLQAAIEVVGLYPQLEDVELNQQVIATLWKEKD